MRQTTVQESRAIRFGSGKVEVGDELANMVDLGAMRDVQFEETWEKVRVMSDNAGAVTVGIRNHRAAIQGNLMEINLQNLALLRGGLDDYNTEGAGTDEKTDTVLSGAWEFGKIILFQHQSYDGTVPTGITVTGNSTLYTLDDDYTVVQDAVGRWGVLVVSGTNSSEAHHLTIVYTHKVAEKNVLTSGGNTTIAPRIVRITNTNEDDKEFRITIYAAEIENGISIDLPGDEEEDPAMVEIRLEGGVDATRDKGDQLFMIEDEQTV
jgi:hypothetical protein